MSQINVSLPSDGTTADVADYNTPVNTIVNDYNGNIDNSNLAAGAAIATSKLATDGGITAGMLGSGVVSNAKVADGFPVQVAYAELATSSTTSTVIPLDNTIPQSGEGAEILTVSITPKSSTNYLVVEFSVMLITSSSTYGSVAALFRDSGADAIGVAMGGSESTTPATVSFKQRVAASSTSATTFKLRVGPSAAGTVRWNGSGSNQFSTTPKASITVTEYKAS